MATRDVIGISMICLSFLVHVLIPLCRKPWSEAWPIWLGFALGTSYFTVTWIFVLRPWLES